MGYYGAKIILYNFGGCQAIPDLAVGSLLRFHHRAWPITLLAVGALHLGWTLLHSPSAARHGRDSGPFRFQMEII